MSERMTIAQFRALKKKKPSKYRNEKTEADGIWFDSKREANRYKDLVLLQEAGEINSLHLQVAFPVTIGPHKICNYIADFYYQDASGKFVIEDSKGMRTPVYKLKKRLVEAIYGIKILET